MTTKTCTWAGALLLSAATLSAQSKIDLRTQTKNVDFSGAAFTKPARMAASLPATCSQGEFFFLTSAPPGQNVYGCAANNTWALEGPVVPQASLLPAQLGNNGTFLGSNGSSAVWQSLGGDVTGPATALTVSAIQGRGISNAAPAAGQLLSYSAATNNWIPTTLQIPPNYGAVFSSATTVTILGTQHNLNTPNLLVNCYDTATPANLVEPSHVTIDPATYNVTVTFATAQSGRCSVNGAGGVGMGATAISGAASLAFPSINPGACSGELTISVPGALLTDSLAAGWPALPAGWIGMLRVSANGTVAVRVCNFSGNAAAPPAATYTATVVRPF